MLQMVQGMFRILLEDFNGSLVVMLEQTGVYRLVMPQ